MPKPKTKRPANPHFNPYPKLGFWGRALCSPFQWRTTQRLLQHILLATALAWLWAGLRCGLWLALFSANTTCSNQDYYNALYPSFIVLQLVALCSSSHWLWRRSTEGAEQFKYYALTGQGYFDLRSGFLDGFVWSKLLILNAGMGVAAMFALGSVTSSGLIQTLNLPPASALTFKYAWAMNLMLFSPLMLFCWGACYLALGQGLLVLRYRQLGLHRIHDIKTYRKTWQARRANHPIVKQQTLWKTIKSSMRSKAP